MGDVEGKQSCDEIKCFNVEMGLYSLLCPFVIGYSIISEKVKTIISLPEVMLVSSLSAAQWNLAMSRGSR